MKILLASFLTLSISQGGLLYSTDFEDFTPGENQWSAQPDWLSNNDNRSNPGVDFIDEQAFNQALGKTATLGLRQPSRTRTRLVHLLNHDHEASGEAIIEIETLISLKDSSNGQRDDFYFSIFNENGTALASIRLDNEDPATLGSNFGFWREDGVNQFDTNFDFIHEELYDLFITIDLSRNLWSASLGGTPLFESAPFTNAASGSEISLAAVAYEWELTANLSSLHGDNFLLVGDLRIVSKASGDLPQLEILTDSTGNPIISWQGFAGKTYQIEYSDQLAGESWKRDLPDSSFSTDEISRRFEFRPGRNQPQGRRFFRLVQSD